MPKASEHIRRIAYIKTISNETIKKMLLQRLNDRGFWEFVKFNQQKYELPAIN
jgi:hypothetical protein